MEGQFNRFKEAPWFPQREENVVIGGAGGIGSWLTFLISRAGFKPVVYDFDIVEQHNLGGQLFRGIDVGSTKTKAISDIIRTYCGDDINAFNRRVDENTMVCPFMFSAFDNMEARKIMFNVWKKNINNCPVTPIFIDGRLTMEQLQVFCVTPQTAIKYEQEYLFDDSEVEDAPCTMRQTSHTAAMIASHMVAFFTNHITNIYEREKMRSVPFYYEYYVPLVLTTLIEENEGITTENNEQ